MEKLFFISIILILTSCGQISPKQKDTQINSISPDTVVTIPEEEIEENTTKTTHPAEKNESHLQSSDHQFKQATLYPLTDSMKADFNGDGNIDLAIFVKDHKTSGIIIHHDKRNQEVRLGFGASFAHFTDFNWVDFWGLVRDTSTYELVIRESEIIGERVVKLECPSIFVRAEEAGGGVITFKEGKYLWIHQAD